MQETGIAQELQRLEERLLDPKVRRDPKEVSALLAEEFKEIGASGRRYTRGEILALLKEEDHAERVRGETVDDGGCSGGVSNDTANQRRDCDACMAQLVVGAAG